MKSTKALNDAMNNLNASRQAKAGKRLTKQPAPSSAGVKTEATNARRERSKKLLPVRHIERDFFLCDMFDYAMKDDGASRAIPHYC